MCKKKCKSQRIKIFCRIFTTKRICCLKFRRIAIQILGYVFKNKGETVLRLKKRRSISYFNSKLQLFVTLKKVREGHIFIAKLLNNFLKMRRNNLQEVKCFTYRVKFSLMLQIFEFLSFEKETNLLRLRITKNIHD